jgi:outer membrane protein assembly factor BamB
MKKTVDSLALAAWTGIALVVLLGDSGGASAAETGPPLGAANFLPSPERPVGWRGDGTGRFPAATPPVQWGRWAKGLTHEIRYQAGRPKDTSKPGGQPLALGIIKDWLVAGPFPIEDPEKDIDRPLLAKEPAIDPDAAEGAGDTAWKAVHVGIETQNNQVVNEGTCDRPNVDFVWAFGERDKHLAYAFTHLYSPTGGKLTLQVFFAGKAVRVWLNGLPVTGNFKDPWRPNAEVELKPGWNRLLVKLSCAESVRNCGCNPKQSQWHFTAYLRPKPPIAYQSRNIPWITPMPGRSYASPCAVGDRVFVTAGLADLLSIDKRSGKVLWLRSHTYFDTLGDGDRSARPEIAREIAPLVAKALQNDEALLRLINAAVSPAGATWQQQEALTNAARQRGELQGKIQTAFRKLDHKAYPRWEENDAGTSNYSPASDGRCVYAVFGGGRDEGTNVVVCYTLEGKRRWIRCLPLGAPEHGNHCSPVLAHGKLVCSFERTLIALDAASGKTLWSYTAPDRNLGLGGATSPLAATIGTSDVVIARSIFDLADGKILWKAAANLNRFAAGTCSTPVLAGQTVFATDGSRSGHDTVAAVRLGVKSSGAVALEQLWQRPGAEDLGPLYHAGHIGSPLLAGGVLYDVDMMGLITATDARTGAQLFRERINRFANCNRQTYGVCASPTLGGQYVFVTENTGGVLILKPGPTYQEVGFNTLESIGAESQEQEVFLSSPVFDGDRMYLRGTANLYCIEEK